MKTTLLLAMLLTSCGPSNASFKNSNVNNTFTGFVAMFEELMSTKVQYTTISFRSQASPQVGLCLYQKGGKENYIYVDPSFWAKASFIEQTSLIFHELGHCHYKLAHIEGQENGCPMSIMSPWIPSETCLDLNFDQYVDQLKETVESGGNLYEPGDSEVIEHVLMKNIEGNNE